MRITETAVRWCRTRAQRLAFCLLLMTATAASAERPSQSQTVDSMVVRMQLHSSAPHGYVAGEIDHRITVALRDKATMRPISDATVGVEVAKVGRAGTRWPLTWNTHDAAYVGTVPMAGRGTAYHIRVQFLRPGQAETFEAQFRTEQVGSVVVDAEEANIRQ